MESFIRFKSFWLIYSQTRSSLHLPIESALEDLNGWSSLKVQKIFPSACIQYRHKLLIINWSHPDIWIHPSMLPAFHPLLEDGLSSSPFCSEPDIPWLNYSKSGLIPNAKQDEKWAIHCPVGLMKHFLISSTAKILISIIAYLMEGFVGRRLNWSR